jgi:hypothetical protein
MKINHSVMKINNNVQDIPLPFPHPVTSLPITGKNHLYQQKFISKSSGLAHWAIVSERGRLQNAEKENWAAELIIANRQLAFQNKEKENRAAELIVANKELAFQNNEKENRAAELVIANKELAFQNNEKENRAAELVIANKELAFQNDEKEKRADELTTACNELEKADEYLKEYIKGLEKMMFITSHKVRQPVCNILGIVSVIDQFVKSPYELKKLVGYLKTSAFSLDDFTRELTAFIFALEKKGKQNEIYVPCEGVE